MVWIKTRGGDGLECPRDACKRGFRSLAGESRFGERAFGDALPSA
eukprot:SAG31_NODE_28764_length_405_cov_1.013072_1_plen_44_part_10